MEGEGLEVSLLARRRFCQRRDMGGQLSGHTVLPLAKSRGQHGQVSPRAPLASPSPVAARPFFHRSDPGLFHLSDGKSDSALTSRVGRAK